MLCTISAVAQNLEDVSYQSTPTDTNFDSLSTNLDTPISIGESFEEAAKKMELPTEPLVTLRA